MVSTELLTPTTTSPVSKTNGVQKSALKTVSVKRARKTAADSGALIYCLEAGSPEAGKIQLSKAGGKNEILLSALKTGVFYYCLQKFTATPDETDGVLTILGVPVE